MPVGLRLSFPENTLEDYDKVCEALNFPADWPDGALAHGSHEADGHLVVNDVGSQGNTSIASWSSGSRLLWARRSATAPGSRRSSSESCTPSIPARPDGRSA
jgi:hypothetical protein